MKLVQRVPDPVFAEAAGVLEMIARNPEERRLSDARLKMERDERARILQARQEGREEDERRGMIVGRIQLLQRLSGLAEQPAGELVGLDLDALSAIENDLQQRLRTRC